MSHSDHQRAAFILKFSICVCLWRDGRDDLLLDCPRSISESDDFTGNDRRVRFRDLDVVDRDTGSLAARPIVRSPP
jgi:hypothetical protein